jgi:hypothetical protein
MKIALAATVAVIALTGAPAYADATGVIVPDATGVILAAVGCHPDQSPGVVTHAEFDRTQTGLTRHQVTCLYGVRGYAIDHHPHIIQYPNNRGGYVTVQYRVRHGVLHAMGPAFRFYNGVPDDKGGTP